jgi:hypothetical protein
MTPDHLPPILTLPETGVMSDFGEKLPFPTNAMNGKNALESRTLLIGSMVGF